MRKKINIDGKTYFLDTDADIMISGEIRPFWNSHQHRTIKGEYKITYTHEYNNDARSNYDEIENVSVKKIVKPYVNTILDKLGQYKYVENLKKNNKNIPNQFVVYFENGEVFQSHMNIIVIKVYNKYEYYLSEKHSLKTIAKYRNLYLEKDTKEIKTDIKNKKAIFVKNL